MCHFDILALVGEGSLPGETPFQFNIEILYTNEFISIPIEPIAIAHEEPSIMLARLVHVLIKPQAAASWSPQLPHNYQNFLPSAVKTPQAQQKPCLPGPALNPGKSGTSGRPKNRLGCWGVTAHQFLSILQSLEDPGRASIYPWLNTLVPLSTKGATHGEGKRRKGGSPIE